MLKAIRNIHFGYILVLLGFIFIVSGISMQDVNESGRTLLCFDDGCVKVQGISNCVLGLFTIAMGILMKIKK